MPTRNLAERAGRWSARHRRVAIFGWLAIVLIAVFAGGAVGLNTLKDEDLGNGESREANQVLADAGFNDRAEEQVLVQARQRGVTVVSPAFRAAVNDAVGALGRFDTVRELKTPLSVVNAGQISADRRSAIVHFQITGDQEEAKDNVAPIKDALAGVQRAHPQFRIEQFGDASADVAITEAFEDDFRKAETLSLPITLVILVLVFGALVAASLPLLLGISAVAITLGVLAPLSQVVPVDESISSLVLLIGLAVGVDYSLFYLRRERDERRAGRSKEAALNAAAATSGRAVLISGATVMIAMAGMFVTGNATFTSFAVATIIVVGVAMLGSVTVLPALLSKLGDNVNRGRVPFVSRLHRERGDGESGFWATVVGGVLRRPWAYAIGGTTLLLVLAIPVLHIHTADSGVQGLSRDLPIMQTYDRIEAAFPGGPVPAIVAVKADDPSDPDVTAALRELRARALATDGLLRNPISETRSPDGTVIAVNVPLAGTGTDDESNRALAVLREDVVPSTIGAVEGTEALVTGLTAQSKDFNEQLQARAPWVFLFVLSLAFVLLMVTFRSIVIPLKAVVLNLLSVGAAYGILVWIFQDGHLESLIGFESIGGIASWLPLFLFVILFGLSMDYHVFILSRVKEGHDKGLSTDEAVRHGIRSTAGVVTSAAVVMVAVFAIFATLSMIDLKQMGIGLALAVLIDATIVRAVLLPASMKLLGDWNWYLPRWLEWLPRVAHDEPAPTAVPPRVVVTGELDLATAPAWRERIVAAEAADPETLVIDLRAVTFLDSAGMKELVAAQQRARKRQAKVVLVRDPNTPVAQILNLAKIDAAVETVEEPHEIR
jgi:RND superfamily putative drug exporter